MSDDELPDILTLVPRSRTARSEVPTKPRRSPRKHNTTSTKPASALSEITSQLFVSSNQRVSPRKQDLYIRSALQATQGKAQKTFLEDVPKLRVASRRQENQIEQAILISDDDVSEDELARVSRPFTGKEKTRFASQDEEHVPRARSSKPKPTSDMSRITQAARRDVQNASRTIPDKQAVTKRPNPYILKEAHCEDLNESSGTDGEDEDTDLSGFIVADDAEVSFHGSAAELSSGEDDRRRRQSRDKKKCRPPPVIGRRLVRGSRRKIAESDDEDLGLSKALDGMRLGESVLQRESNIAQSKKIEIVDLTSSPVQEKKVESRPSHLEDSISTEDSFHSAGPVSKLSFIPDLQSKEQDTRRLVPSKLGPLLSSPKRPAKELASTQRPTTPPATPPRSPSKTKLKSPTKLLSPSKHDREAPRSPHRQSMAGFWDHGAVNDWHEIHSPKKAPLLSPRKNPLARFNLALSDDIEDSDLEGPPQGNQSSSSSQDTFDDSSHSLPSPTASPSKSRSPSKMSALKAEQVRMREEKRAKLAAKKAFDSEKEQMANDLVAALDKYTTNSKINEMSASTGGIQIIWSKTLRSTAGRANWKRTVSKPSASPVKGNIDSQSIEKQPGVVVQHFASIELAEKIIDRPERLVNTLAHEFCHLANFMISGVRDQPHGESFKKWGVKVTSWLKCSAAKKAVGFREIWKVAEVTTKHSYVIETKYLWVCTGRPAAKQKQSLTQKMLNIEPEDEEGCGAEYGRHSKSIDVEKQRCGRCKGFLVQVRPIPRAVSSPRKSPVKRIASTREKEDADSIGKLERMLGIVDLSD